MNTWREILESLNSTTDERLDDPAVMWWEVEFAPLELLEIEIPEIGDQRLVALPLEEVE